MKKNGYNAAVASVLCDRQPKVMLADVVAGELRAVGFRVLTDRRQAGSSTIVIAGTLQQLFIEPKLNYFTSVFETDAALTLSARTASGLWAVRTIYVKGEEATVMGSDEDMQLSFDSGVRQLVTAVVGAIANLADRFPPSVEPMSAAAAISDPPETP